MIKDEIAQANMKLGTSGMKKVAFAEERGGSREGRRGLEPSLVVFLVGRILNSPSAIYHNDSGKKAKHTGKAERRSML